MGINSSVSGLWTFNGNTEDVNNNDFSSSQVSSYIQFQRYSLRLNQLESKFGLLFTENVPFTANGVSLSSGGNKRFSISFWWYSPAAVGYTRHAVTRNLTSKVVPILAQAESSIFEDNELVSVGEFIISEVAASQTTNAIKLELCSTGVAPTHSYISTSYSPGLVHVFISYETYNDGISNVVKMYINGKMDYEFQGPKVSIPDTASNLYLNKIYHGYSSHKSFQEGSYISELVIKNDYDSRYCDAINVIRWGYESITDDDEILSMYSYFGIGLDQPSTITTNQIYSEGGNIYLARSNGDILKGFRPIWDNEFTYKTQSHIDNLTSGNPNNIEKISSGAGINVTGTTIRI